MMAKPLSIKAACAAALLFVGVPAYAHAERIVSVGGSTTEIVYALGAGERLVGADTTSIYPAAADALPDVGYVRQLSAEGLLSLSPDLILAGGEAGPDTALAQTEAAGVRIVKLEEGFAPEDVYAHIAEVGAALGRDAEAAALNETLKQDMDRVLADVAKIEGRKPRVMFLLQAGRGGLLVAGSDTAAHAMIELAGGENPASTIKGYKPFSPEAATEAAPDILLVTDQTIEMLGGGEKLLADPALAATPAGKAKRIVSMDALYLAGFGPRLAHALRDLAAGFHPGAEIAPLPARPWTEAQ
ncbi:MAG: ABC transporter substrate-binding protein [Parvibaculum sp.]|nr:ABC transporter substrate-binding protein [Parvibaculum sp.]